MPTRKQLNPLNLPSRKDALEVIRREQFLSCIGHGKSIVEIEQDLALEEEDGKEI